MLPSACKIYGDADFIFQQGLAPSIAPQQGHRLIRSMPLRIDAVISFERSPNQVLHNQEHTFQKAGISVLIIIFLLVLCDIQIFEDTQFLVFLSC
jgi:hypothetical protein